MYTKYEGFPIWKLGVHNHWKDWEDQEVVQIGGWLEKTFLEDFVALKSFLGSSHKLSKLGASNQEVIRQQKAYGYLSCLWDQEGNLQTHPEATVKFMPTVSPHIYLSLPTAESNSCSLSFQCHISASWQTLEPWKGNSGSSKRLSFSSEFWITGESMMPNRQAMFSHVF